MRETVWEDESLVSVVKLLDYVSFISLDSEKSVAKMSPLIIPYCERSFGTLENMFYII